MTRPTIDLDRLRSIRPDQFWYLASPYSQYHGGMEAACKLVSLAAAWLLRNGVRVFCPIAHSHTIAVHGDLSKTDHELWGASDLPFVNAACGCIVCALDGWEQSEGVTQELRMFSLQGKEVYFMDWPGNQPETECNDE